MTWHCVHPHPYPCTPEARCTDACRPRTGTTLTVKRIETPTGTHIEPPLDQAWSEIDKLRWHAEVASMDAGLRISVNELNDAPTPYGIVVGSSSSAPFSFASAWTFLNGVSTGATERKRVTA